MALLDKISYKAWKDKLYFVGDLINRGPNALEVLDFVIKTPNVYAVKGNHELYFLDWLKWNLNISDADKYSQITQLFPQYKQQFSPEMIHYIQNLPLYIETDKRILVHAGIVPWKTLSQHSPYELTKLRLYNGKPWYELYNWEKIIIYWHWAKDGVRIRPLTKGLDSGCVYGKRLTAYIWENEEIIQQYSFDQYVKI